MNATATHSFTTPRSHQELIAQRAQELWNARGRPDGQDFAIWIDAERDLIRRRLIPARVVTPGSGNNVDADKVAERLNDFGRASAEALSLSLPSGAPSTRI